MHIAPQKSPSESVPPPRPAVLPARQRTPKFRWLIAILLCFASELNYLDRQALSVLAQTIQDELHITTIQYAQITSAFLISYTVMYAISGLLAPWAILPVAPYREC